jgi:hypothetical protein
MQPNSKNFKLARHHTSQRGGVEDCGGGGGGSIVTAKRLTFRLISHKISTVREVILDKKEIVSRDEYYFLKGL